MSVIAPATARAQTASSVAEVETIELDDSDLDAVAAESGSASGDAGSYDEILSAIDSLSATRSGVSLSKIPDLSKRVRGRESTSFSGSAASGDGAFSFATSFAAMRREAAEKKGYQSSATKLFAATRAPVDIWVSGSYTYFGAEGAASRGDTGVMQAGVDYRIGKDVAAGLFVSGDMLDRRADAAADMHGVGYLTGPYAVVRLSENVRFETLAAFGSAHDEVVTADDDYAVSSAPRVQVSTRLSGDWSYDSWTLSPSSRLSFYGESLDPIDGSVVSDRDAEGGGSLTFGPQVAYTLDIEDGSVKPFAGLEGAVGFGLSGDAGTDSRLTTGAMSANSVLGVDAKLGDTTIRASGRCTGVGAGASDESCATMGGDIQLKFPLN